MTNVVELPARRQGKRYSQQINKNMAVLADSLLKNGSRHSPVYREGMIASFSDKLMRLSGIEPKTREPYSRGSLESDAWLFGYARGLRELRDLNARGFLTERLLHPR